MRKPPPKPNPRAVQAEAARERKARNEVEAAVRHSRPSDPFIMRARPPEQNEASWGTTNSFYCHARSRAQERYRVSLSRMDFRSMNRAIIAGCVEHDFTGARPMANSPGNSSIWLVRHPRSYTIMPDSSLLPTWMVAVFRHDKGMIVTFLPSYQQITDEGKCIDT